MTLPHTRPLTQKTLHLQDARPPQDIQALLERQTQAVLHPLDAAQRQARWRQGPLRYQLTLRLDAVLTTRQAYTVHIQAEGDTGLWERGDLRRQAESWIALWLQYLEPADAVKPRAGSATAHAELCRAWARAEAPLRDAQAIRQAIVQGLRQGGSYSSAHKEGGSTLSYADGHCVNLTYGDWPSKQVFRSEAEVLDFLWQKLHHNAADTGQPLAEADSWRLIYRLMEGPGPSLRTLRARGHGARDGWRFWLAAPRLAAMLAVCAAAGLLGWLRWHPVADSVRPQQVELTPLPSPPPTPDWARIEAEHRRAIEAAQAAAAR